MQPKACEGRGKTDLLLRLGLRYSNKCCCWLLLFLKGLLLVRERKPCRVLRADTLAGMFRYHLIRTS